MVIENLSTGAITGSVRQPAKRWQPSPRPSPANLISSPQITRGGTGNDLILTVPEPTSATLLFATGIFNGCGAPAIPQEGLIWSETVT
jgi:hypothetical protein